MAFWIDQSVSLISLEAGFREVVRQKVGAELLPRSVLLVTMERAIYLLVTLGDGTLYYYLVDPKDGANVCAALVTIPYV